MRAGLVLEIVCSASNPEGDPPPGCHEDYTVGLDGRAEKVDPLEVAFKRGKMIGSATAQGWVTINPGPQEQNLCPACARRLGVSK